MNLQMTGLLSQLGSPSILGINNNRNLSHTSRLGTATANRFGKIIKQQQINNIRQEIYDKFQISIGSSNGSFSCYIPSETLYRMSTDSQLREKIYTQLETCSSDQFQESLSQLNPSLKSYRLDFNEKGNMTVTLSTATTPSTVGNLYNPLLYNQASGINYHNNLLSASSSWLPYQSLLLSGYGSSMANPFLAGLGYSSAGYGASGLFYNHLL